MSSSGTDEQAPEFRVTFKSIEQSLTIPFVHHFPLWATRLENDEDGTTTFQGGLVRSDPGNLVLNGEYACDAEKVYRFQPRESDVWITSFPKCGTTWTQELVWLLINNCDTEAAKRTPIDLRSPFLELPYLVAEGNPIWDPIRFPIEFINAMPLTQRRMIKTHLPFYLLNPKLIDICKVVYVARNPKDVIVSYYHHHKLFHEFDGDFSAFARYFLDDLVIYSPFFNHLLNAWSKRHHPNLLFIFFEDLKKDLGGVIKKIATFLDISISDEELEKIKNHLSFKNLAQNPMTNLGGAKDSGLLEKGGSFIRKGKTGDWKNYFSPELNEETDRWVKEQLGDSDLSFIDFIDE